MWKFSRYWNKFAYLFVRLGRFMVWDYSGLNDDILGDDFASEGTIDVMTSTK